MTESNDMTPHEKWQIERDAKNVALNYNADQLSDKQRKVLMDDFIAIKNADCSCHEMFRVDVDDMIALDKSEYMLRSAFPQLTEEAVANITCTCED